MIDKIKTLFGGRQSTSPQGEDGRGLPLRIEGIKDAPLTPEPDDAELAAQALLEVIVAERENRRSRRNNGNTQKGQSDGKEKFLRSAISAGQKEKDEKRDAAYYRRLSRKIQAAHEQSRLRLTRFLAFVEWKLKDKHLPWYGEGSVALLETELYKRLDVVEREGGELKTRWQHCLADVTVRMMSAPPPETEEVTQKAQKSQKE